MNGTPHQSLGISPYHAHYEHPGNIFKLSPVQRSASKVPAVDDILNAHEATRMEVVEFVTGRTGPRKMRAPGPFPALPRSTAWGGVSFSAFPAPVAAQAPPSPIPQTRPR